MNGKLVPTAEAALPFMTPALHYGNEIDHRTISKGGTGAVTRQLQKLYTEATHGAHARSGEWCTNIEPKVA